LIPRSTPDTAMRQNVNSRSKLLVFAKVPRPGRVKTRLCPPLGAEQATRLYAAMVGDAIEAYASLGFSVRVYVAPDPDPFPAELLPPRVTVHTQMGVGLGERMLHALEDAFSDGAERAVLIGTDHPTLPLAYITQAFEAVSSPETVVLGPTLDGGYYLVGMSRSYPELFMGMTYSHPGVLEETLDRATATDASVTLLRSWYDVDDVASLQHLAEDLTQMPATVAVRTRKAIQKYFLEVFEGET